MASDVLRTGEDYDLNPSDGYVDDDTDPRLVEQHVRDSLNMFRGEWIFNGTYGMDWLRIKSSKLDNLTFLAAEIRRFVAAIPNMRNVNVASTEREGRSISITLTGQYNRVQQDIRVYIPLAATSNVGYNGMAHVYFRARG
jgi:hypothetical protein